MRKILLTTAAAVALSTGALAADLPARVPAVAPAPIFVGMNWTGFYVGAQIGYAWGKATQPYGVPATAVTFPLFQANADQNGALGGLHLGYNHQFGQMVLGVEGDIEVSGVKGHDGGSGGDINGLKNSWNASLRLRAGYAFDKALLYVTGGVAYLDAKATKENGAPENIGVNFTGWTIGGGLEYAFTRNITGRVEYRYTDYGKTTARFPVSGYAERINPQHHTVRVGISYLFGGPAGAVVAKY